MIFIPISLIMVFLGIIIFYHFGMIGLYYYSIPCIGACVIMLVTLALAGRPPRSSYTQNKGRTKSHTSSDSTDSSSSFFGDCGGGSDGGSCGGGD